MENTEKKKLPSATKNSLACGYMGLFFWIIPTLGSFVGIVGIMFGVKGYKLKKKKLAYLSISLCSVAIVLSLLNGIYGFFKWNPKFFFTAGSTDEIKEEQLTKYTDSIYDFEISYPSYLKRELRPKTIFYVINPEMDKGIFLEKIGVKISTNLKNYETQYKRSIEMLKKNAYEIPNLKIEKNGTSKTIKNREYRWILTSYTKDNLKLKTLQAEYLSKNAIYRITISATPTIYSKNEKIYSKILKTFLINR